MYPKRTEGPAFCRLFRSLTVYSVCSFFRIPKSMRRIPLIIFGLLTTTIFIGQPPCRNILINCLYFTTSKIPKQPKEMATKTVAAPEESTSAVIIPPANARAHLPQQRTCSQRSLGAQNIVFASLSCSTEQKKLRYHIIYRRIKKCYLFSEIISTVPSSTAIQAESDTMRLLTPSGKPACRHCERSG